MAVEIGHPQSDAVCARTSAHLDGVDTCVAVDPGDGHAERDAVGQMRVLAILISWRQGLFGPDDLTLLRVPGAPVLGELSDHEQASAALIGGSGPAKPG